MEFFTDGIAASASLSLIGILIAFIYFYDGGCQHCKDDEDEFCGECENENFKR